MRGDSVMKMHPLSKLRWWHAHPPEDDRCDPPLAYQSVSQQSYGNRIAVIRSSPFGMHAVLRGRICLQPEQQAASKPGGRK
jgi:hypothetical protein